MPKGRHRRHRDARELKRAGAPTIDTLDALEGHSHAQIEAEFEDCPECQRTPHAEWCLATDDDL